jgi:hypothetical protein
VRKSEANSHAKVGWQTFTDAVISHLNRNHANLVFMLWGGFAQKKGAIISTVLLFFQDSEDLDGILITFWKEKTFGIKSHASIATGRE